MAFNLHDLFIVVLEGRKEGRFQLSIAQLQVFTSHTCYSGHVEQDGEIRPESEEMKCELSDSVYAGGGS